MNDSATSLVLDYVGNMGDYWDGNSRQEKKSSGRFNLLKKNLGWSGKSLVSLVSEVAEIRILESGKTIYLSSFGSSGSHLIQHIIDLTVPAIPLGEVYIAPRLERELKKLSSDQKFKFIEMYHLIHSTSPNTLFSNSVIVNTAHKAKLQTFSEATANFSSAFIVRNPVDLVMSRTFRKDEYRKYLGKDGGDDYEYLVENIEKTVKYYKSAFSYSYDEYLVFEDLFSDKNGLVSSISNLIGREVDGAEIKSNIEKALNEGKTTNKYKGEVVEISDDFYGVAKKMLSGIMEDIDRRGLKVYG